MTIENKTPETEKQAEQPEKNPGEPNAYRVEDDKNLEEKNLKRNYLFGNAEMKSTSDPGMEGQGMGGQSFGSNNLTPAGNDEANPPRNAGEDNAYFRRTQPAEEHPEDENFVLKSQEGGADGQKDQPNIPGPQELPDQQKVGEGTGEDNSHRPNPQQPYQEGTVDEDGPKGYEKKEIPMNTNLQPGQKVSTPDGEGTVQEINGEKVSVRLSDSETRIYHPRQLEDDSNAG